MHSLYYTLGSERALVTMYRSSRESESDSLYLNVRFVSSQSAVVFAIQTVKAVMLAGVAISDDGKPAPFSYLELYFST